MLAQNLKTNNLGQSLRDVLAAASEVASVQARDEISKHVTSAVTSGVLQKAIALALLTLTSAIALYFLSHSLLVWILGTLNFDLDPSMTSHGVLLVVSILGFYLTVRSFMKNL